MDQRVKGGTPPTTASTLDASSAPEQDRVAERRRSEDEGKKEEEKRGCKREGDKGAVLEVLIEGRCGGVGQQELQISGRETSCPEGNVRVRIGLQAKRTKKPPKSLESYVCKPTFRTYQRQGRGGLLRADGEGKPIQQSKGSSTTNEASREQRVGLDATQATSKKTASAASQPLTSSSSSPQPLSLSSTKSTPASVPTTTSQGTKTTKQVPIKLADKAEENSNGSSERVKKDKHPSVPAGPKPCSPLTDQTASTARFATSNPKVSTLDTRNEGSSSKKHNGLVQTAKQKGLSDGRSSANILGTSSKNKAGKLVILSSASSMDSSARPQVSSGSHVELSSKSRSASPSHRPVSPKSQFSPDVDLSSTQSKDQDLSQQPPVEKKREKAKKAKKEKRKDKKSKQDKLEAGRKKTEKLKDDITKKKREKGKDGKSRNEKEKAQKQKTDDSWEDELKTERGKVEKREKLSPDGQRTVDTVKCGEATCKQDKTCKVVTEKEKTEPDKQAEPSTGDPSKSKEQDISRRSAVPPARSTSSAPPPLLSPSAHVPIPPPSSPQEQDSRPLKKRKARRPSWTKLVHRAHRMDSQEVFSGTLHSPSPSFPQITKASFPDKTTIHQSDESQLPPPSGSISSCSSQLSSAVKPPTPKQTHPASDLSPTASVFTTISVRKRGRPKSHSFSLDETPPRLSPNDGSVEELPTEHDRVQKAPVLEPVLHCTSQPSSSLKKRGRPPKRALPVDDSEDVLDHIERSKGFQPLEKASRQLKIRRLINEMKKRKKRRLHKAIMSGYVRKEGRGVEAAGGKTSLGMCKPFEATTVHTLSALSSSFGSKLGPQINVSKRGTIYMGKRRGRKPKSQTANRNSSSQCSTQPSLFTSHSEASLFSSNQPPPFHPFPSPSLTHSSGAQSPYSDGSFTEPTSSFLFSHHFSLPSPTSSCTSPRPPSSSSLSPFVKKSCPCQGRHQFPFHQSTCMLSCATPLHLTPGSPSHLKEATPSPRSESHSDETLPSDSGIGTDNNSVSERGEFRGARGILRFGQGSGVTVGRQRLPPSPVSSLNSHMSRHSNAIGTLNSVERHRHRHRRRDYDCPSSYTCLCPCPGQNKCTQPDYASCLGHGAVKRQKNKHKKKHQQLLMQDPEFLAELDDLITQFGDVHIGRRSWARTGLGSGFDQSASGGRRHFSPSSSHSLRSNIFRINLNGFYSPHPSSFSTGSSFSPQSFYPCHCSRKLDRRQCSCHSKFQETIDNVGFYSSYPTAPPTLYHHLPSSYPLPPPHQYALHQPHHAHFLLNPARFHRRRSRLLREGALGAEVEGGLGAGGKGGGGGSGSAFTSSLSCAWGRSEHKHKHRHRHFEQNVDDDEEDDGMEREVPAASKSQSGLVQADEGRRSSRRSGSMLSKESPWLRQNGTDLFSAAASSSLSSSAERYKSSPLTSLRLGSSHLSSFGGGWGGLGQSWAKFRNLGSPGFGKPSWPCFTGERPAGRLSTSDREDEDEGDDDEPHPYGTSLSPTHTNLFTSAAMATAARGPRSGSAFRNTGSGERSWRKDEPAWTERREAGLQGDSRSRGQQQCSVPAPVKSKRGPGRPRKHPLPPASAAAASSPTFSSAAPFVSPPDLLPASRDGREAGGRAEGTVPERGGGGGSAAQQVTELEARRKRGRKRKHGASPGHESSDNDQSESDALPELLGRSDVDQAPSQPASVRREDGSDGPPGKTFLRAGLYSDDYKTTDPPSEAQNGSDNLEDTPGEHECSLLPAPIHVGKYLRLKRIHFQLPYDVMWLWQHDQLYRQPAVPLKRKRRYCRLKQRIASFRPTVESSRDITSLFPHLDVEPLNSSERSFVVKHRVFLIRNLELVRDRQIQMRMEREMDEEEEGAGEEGEDGTSGDDSHFKSDHSVGAEVTIISSDPHHQSQDTSGACTASPSPTKTQNRQEEEEEEEAEEEEGEEINRELCSREQRRKRLNDLLLQRERWSHSAKGTGPTGGHMDSN